MASLLSEFIEDISYSGISLHSVMRSAGQEEALTEVVAVNEDGEDVDAVRRYGGGGAL